LTLDFEQFGCVLIELFGSMIPWASAKDDNEIGRRVTGRDEAAIVPPEIERVPQVAMKALIRRCLRRTPTDRCTSAQALAEIEKQAMSLGR
jgi:serine/threonine protein kinase